jgi:hypothetical protein
MVAGCAEIPPAGPLVRPGIEVLLEDSSHLIADRRVGLLTNQTGIDRSMPVPKLQRFSLPSTGTAASSMRS